MSATAESLPGVAMTSMCVGGLRAPFFNARRKYIMSLPTHICGMATVRKDSQQSRLWRVHILWDKHRTPFMYHEVFVAKAQAQLWVECQFNLQLETNEYFDRIVRNFSTLPPLDM